MTNPALPPLDRRAPNPAVTVVPLSTAQLALRAGAGLAVMGLGIFGFKVWVPLKDGTHDTTAEWFCIGLLIAGMFWVSPTSMKALLNFAKGIPAALGRRDHDE